ncbi:hypothetical protein [Peribacillus butanolivorans]|uniref:hypothetical protein n=1 Tax=Peribacillus butanolivorans TaxID=421767 RepID=UPI0036703BAB
MAWKPVPKAVVLAVRKYIKYVDSRCRKDLNERLLVSERDYVSRFITHLTYPLGPLYNKAFIWSCRTLPGNLEQSLGTDAIIIIANSDDEDEGAVLYKVGLFESKWPLDHEGKARRFDSILSSKPISRYSNQLDLQRPFHRYATIWSAFLNGYKDDSTVILPGGKIKKPQYRRKGSTCVLHDEAYDYMVKRGAKSHHKWLIKDLDDMIKQVKKTYSFGKIISDMLKCKMGDPIKGNEEYIGLGEVKVPIPSFINYNQNESNDRSSFLVDLDKFMNDYGFTHYIYINLKDLSELGTNNYFSNFKKKLFDL